MAMTECPRCKHLSNTQETAAVVHRCPQCGAVLEIPAELLSQGPSSGPAAGWSPEAFTDLGPDQGNVWKKRAEQARRFRGQAYRAAVGLVLGNLAGAAAGVGYDSWAAGADVLLGALLALAGWTGGTVAGVLVCGIVAVRPPTPAIFGSIQYEVDFHAVDPRVYWDSLLFWGVVGCLAGGTSGAAFGSQWLAAHWELNWNPNQLMPHGYLGAALGLAPTTFWWLFLSRSDGKTAE